MRLGLILYICLVRRHITKMKKYSFKSIALLCVVAVLLIVGVAWISYGYISPELATIKDQTSILPEGKLLSVVLEAMGEAIWPFIQSVN